ncbi:hypothetical protein BGZ81_002335 [Podila clonocystis]|nr:hypothetical protein BGZ81_002335 [Podila clonocystis]
MKTLHWALSSSDGVKEYGLSTFPYIEFPGWTGPDSVQSHINRITEQLPDDESKRMMDALFPSAAVNMHHKRLTGRFRPIVTAIEGIIKTGELKKWGIVSASPRSCFYHGKNERRGNLCGELNRTLLASLAGDETRVGYSEQESKLAISHKNTATHDCTKAHVNRSKREDQDVPPFYFPAPHVSGPDIVFYVKISGNVYPVFVQ